MRGRIGFGVIASVTMGVGALSGVALGAVGAITTPKGPSELTYAKVLPALVVGNVSQTVKIPPGWYTYSVGTVSADSCMAVASKGVTLIDRLSTSDEPPDVGIVRGLGAGGSVTFQCEVEGSQAGSYMFATLVPTSMHGIISK